jgi:hypothetical protein
MEIWIAIDDKTSSIVGFGNQSDAQSAANMHHKLSGNSTRIRKLKIGMTIYE